MGRPAECECAKCFDRTPKATSRSFEISVHSGDSFGFSYGSKPNSAKRFSSRTYYRQKTIWLCQSCSLEFESYVASRTGARRELARLSWRWTGGASMVLLIGAALFGTVAPWVCLPLLISAAFYLPRNYLHAYLNGDPPPVNVAGRDEAELYSPPHRPPRIEDRQEPRF